MSFIRCSPPQLTRGSLGASWRPWTQKAIQGPNGIAPQTFQLWVRYLNPLSHWSNWPNKNMQNYVNTNEIVKWLFANPPKNSFAYNHSFLFTIWWNVGNWRRQNSAGDSNFQKCGKHYFWDLHEKYHKTREWMYKWLFWKWLLGRTGSSFKFLSVFEKYFFFSKIICFNLSSFALTYHSPLSEL